jgi:hypothetical protein
MVVSIRLTSSTNDRSFGVSTSAATLIRRNREQGFDFGRRAVSDGQNCALSRFARASLGQIGCNRNVDA